MKKIVSQTVTWIIVKLARLTVWRFRPGIVGVTGSAGKTSTKLAIAAVLGSDRHVRVARGNFNTEIGLALAIIGDYSEEDLRVISRDAPPGTNPLKKIAFFLRVIFGGLGRALAGWRHVYPEILILEYGIDHPGDMRRLLRIARPNVGVVTAVGDIPAHVEFFASPEDVAQEKIKLVEQLPAASFAILNGDDAAIMDLKERVRAHVMTFGFGQGVQLRITGFEHRLQNNIPVGIGFKLEYGGAMVPVRLDDTLGRAQAYAAAAAAAVGLIFGLNLVRIAEALQAYSSPKQRTKLFHGINGSLVIDDCYNANPLSMHAALDTLQDLPAHRKIAVLGDMLEIGRFAPEAHQLAGETAGKIVDILMTVGPLAAHIAEGAHKAGLRKGDIYVCETAAETIPELKKILRAGDLVLIKASHSVHLEQVVEAVKAHSDGAIV